MAQWTQAATDELARGIKRAQLDQNQAQRLREDIDCWAGTIGKYHQKTFPSASGQGRFVAHTQNHTVESVDYSW